MSASASRTRLNIYTVLAVVSTKCSFWFGVAEGSFLNDVLVITLTANRPSLVVAKERNLTFGNTMKGTMKEDFHLV